MSASTTITTSGADRDARDRTGPPDLMALGDKLDAAFGKSDAATEALIAASIEEFRRRRSDARVIVLGGEPR